MEILTSQTLTPADMHICQWQLKFTPQPPPLSLPPVSSIYPVYLLFIFVELTGRKKRLLCWHIPRPEFVISDVLNQLDCCIIGLEKLEWVLSHPLPKDVVKMSMLNE